MPVNSVLYQYSNIGMKALGEFTPEQFLFQNKKLCGFWVSRYLEEIPEHDVQKFREAVASDIAPNGPHHFASIIQAEFPLEKYEEARKQYVKNMSKGKVLLKM